VSRSNPLTARTFVNRLWKQFFGTGLSSIVDDLGTQGEYPSHPELLDWLAVDFMDRGWDVKAMVRTIVTSATYRQSSTYRPELAEVDPNNRLLARQAPRRLEAEFVRDNALAAAGLIDPRYRRPERLPLPAGGLLRGAAVSRPRLPPGRRRAPVPPRGVHALAANVPAPHARQLRRPVARGMHGLAQSSPAPRSRP
jgi:hypothetical protein